MSVLTDGGESICVSKLVLELELLLLRLAALDDHGDLVQLGLLLAVGHLHDASSHSPDENIRGLSGPNLLELNGGKLVPVQDNPRPGRLRVQPRLRQDSDDTLHDPVYGQVWLRTQLSELG